MQLLRLITLVCLMSTRFAEASTPEPTPDKKVNSSLSNQTIKTDVQKSSPSNLPAVATLHLDWIDSKVSPSQNFYAYANGAWQKANPIPPDYTVWGSFQMLQEKVQTRIHEMLISLANKSNAPGSIEQKVANFYKSGMNESLINQVGVQPLMEEFNGIQSIKTSADLQTVIAHLQRIGVNALFGFGSMADFKDSQRMIGAVIQGGLGLPERDYYLDENPKFAEIRSAYVTHLAKMFELLGDEPKNAANEAQTVMAVETRLAKASMTSVEKRDPYAIYHMMDVASLDKMTPHFSWKKYFDAMGQPHIKRINCAMPAFFKAMDEAIAQIPMDDWKVYLRWKLIDSFAPYLSTAFVDQDFHMNSVIGGAKTLQPRWKRVVAAANGGLGFGIGKLYVKQYFSPKEKAAVLEILNNIRAVLKKDLTTLAWMTPATRTAALKKLSQIEDRVGYPDKWWDYSRLSIDQGPYVLNILHVNQFLVDRDLNKIDKPVDRSEWEMTPQTVNAYYDPSMNNINLPAGILNSPLFAIDAPAAVNYGGIGFVIGHEITHGFDDKGALFDGKGNLNNWWAPEDLKRFEQATQCIVKQYSSYQAAGLPVKGELVVGEATADLGGLAIAYRAFHQAQANKKAPTIAGFTPDQQFFLSVAHVWAANIRPEQARNLVTTDPHPPMEMRVNGTLANMPAFQAAFDIPKDSPMVSRQQCHIW